MTNKPELSEPVALSDDLCLTAAGVEVAKEIASDLGDCANVARLVAHQIPGGYVDLQAALFLLVAAGVVGLLADGRAAWRGVSSAWRRRAK